MSKSEVEPARSYTLRRELPELPDRIKRLPIDARGYPVPWFVAYIDGVPDFRIMDGAKYARAVKERRCWVCGDFLGSFLSFVVGPMCAVNRISSEPPSHRECAEFSVRACPFLVRPHMRRREAGKPENGRPGGGVMIDRNPGVALVWTTKTYRVVNDGHGGYVVEMGEPTSIACFAEGRHATRDEIRASVDSGYPILLAAANVDGAEGVRALERATVVARKLLGVP